VKTTGMVVDENNWKILHLCSVKWKLMI